MTDYYLYKIIPFIYPALYFSGLGITIWAYRVSRKYGYLIIAAYFFLALFSLFAMPFINRIFANRYIYNVKEVSKQEMNSEIDQEISQELQNDELGHKVSVPAIRQLYFQLGPIILVAGLWLVVKKEKKCQVWQFKLAA